MVKPWDEGETMRWANTYVLIILGCQTSVHVRVHELQLSWNSLYKGHPVLKERKGVMFEETSMFCFHGGFSGFF